MTTASTSPEPTQGEPHPAVRLAELVCALIAAIAGPSWFWRFLPGGRAFWAQMHRMGQDFAALMQRLAATPPPAFPLIPLPLIPATTAPPRRHRARTGEPRPRRAPATRQPRRKPAAIAPRTRAPRPACAHPTPPARLHQPFLDLALRERRRRNPLLIAAPTHACIVAMK